MTDEDRVNVDVAMGLGLFNGYGAKPWGGAYVRIGAVRVLAQIGTRARWHEHWRKCTREGWECV